jgi:uncharacterized protein (DUF169 family)
MLWKKVLEKIDNQIRPEIPPLAVKLLKKVENIPERAIRPKRDFGHHMAICQALAMSGRNRKVIAETLEDMWCPEAIFCFGFAEPHEDFLNGTMNFSEGPGQYLKNLEAGKNCANSFPRLKPRKHVGIVIAPAEKAEFEPDLFLIFCNTSQINTLQGVRRYTDGRPINADLGGGGCIRAIVPTIKDRKCHIALPCGGLYKYALIPDDKMIFTIPNDKQELEAMIEGFDFFGDGVGSRIWTPDVPLPSGYLKLRKKMGWDTPETTVFS